MKVKVEIYMDFTFTENVLIKKSICDCSLLFNAYKI